MMKSIARFALLSMPSLGNALGFGSLNLTAKISLFVTILMLGAIGVLATVFIVSEREKVNNDIVASGRVFAQFTSASIAQWYGQFYAHNTVSDFEEFKTRVQHELQLNKDVIHVSLVGLSGKVLFDSDEFKKGKYTGPVRNIQDTVTLQNIQKDIITDRHVALPNGDTAVEIVVPIIEASGDHILSMRYLLSANSLKERMQQVYTQILFTIIPLIAASIMGAIPFAVVIARPIVRLTKATTALGQGNFDVQIPVQSKDEIGQLGAAFNTMAQDLKKSRAALEEYSRTLEQQVADRTKELQEKMTDMERLQKIAVNRELKMIELKKELGQLKGATS